MTQPAHYHGSARSDIGVSAPRRRWQLSEMHEAWLGGDAGILIALNPRQAP